MNLPASPRTALRFPASARYLVGVSGGRDSVVLLHWLLSRGYKRLTVCHLDHGLRGRASRGDLEFVRRLATKWKLPFATAKRDVAGYAAKCHQSIEQTAREMRLGFFGEVACRRRCYTVFLAHHADDQVETFLMRLLRGAGGCGLGAMREVSEFAPLRFVRPFLGVWRSEIDAYVAEHRLKFREDASNLELVATRNRTRHLLIPQLEKQLGRNVRQNIWRAASVFSEEDALMESLVPVTFFLREATLPVEMLIELPIALQRRTILRWLRSRGIRDLGYNVVERVRSLLAPGGAVAKVNLPGDRHARRRDGELFIE
ncbi:MAG: tRNA lysidine(34) synthetase TilS [Chthoniobacterales bacterium]|nr:tRNA lysidine(34) synthetase TilS [Chthoniobacterales bacterium]